MRNGHLGDSQSLPRDAQRGPQHGRERSVRRRVRRPHGIFFPGARNILGNVAGIFTATWAWNSRERIECNQSGARSSSTRALFSKCVTSAFKLTLSSSAIRTRAL